MELAGKLFPLWSERKYLAGSLIEIDELVTAVDGVLRAGATLAIPSVTLAPRPLQ